MPHIIGRARRASETYPEPPRRGGGGGPFVRMGFGNSIEEATYNESDFVPVMRANDENLTVPLTGFTPGNIILIAYSMAGHDAISSGPLGLGFFVKATVDLDGGGQKAIVPSNIGFRAVPSDASDTKVEDYGFGWNTFYKPPALSVTQTPVIGLLISSVGRDPVQIVAGGALIWVAEIDPAFVTQNPDTSLEP